MTHYYALDLTSNEALHNSKKHCKQLFYLGDEDFSIALVFTRWLPWMSPVFPSSIVYHLHYSYNFHINAPHYRKYMYEKNCTEQGLRIYWNEYLRSWKISDDLHLCWSNPMATLTIIHHHYHQKKPFWKKIHKDTPKHAWRNKRSVFDLPKAINISDVWINVSCIVSKTIRGNSHCYQDPFKR